jgi:DNA-binding winged helix-turn-helix (wHTH) protein
VTATDRLLRFVWRDDGGDGNVLKTHVSHIRQKLQQANSGLAITAVPNVGYILTDVKPSPIFGGIAQTSAS